MSAYHESVLSLEVSRALAVEKGKIYIDATVGGGGHAVEILRRGGMVLGIDADEEAVAEASSVFTSNGFPQTMWKVVHGNFRNIKDIAKESGFEEVSGVLFDLGVSSHQLNTPNRGFSYRYPEAPLDLRLDQHAGETVAKYVSSAPENELYEVFATYGEEERARIIARTIVRSRVAHPIVSVGDVIASVREATGGAGEEAVLSRVFQALRIWVNDEMGALNEGLEGAKQVLMSGGKLAVISFHSLEDRHVKRFMRSGGFDEVTKKPIMATEEERLRNRRSRSAKLRVAQKI